MVFHKSYADSKQGNAKQLLDTPHTNENQYAFVLLPAVTRSQPNETLMPFLYNYDCLVRIEVFERYVPEVVYRMRERHAGAFAGQGVGCYPR